MKYIAAILAVCAMTAQAQTASPTIFESLQDVFDSRGTNSLMNAGEVNASLLLKWNTALQSAGGAAKIDWWVSPQQGAFFQFEEYANGRTAFWSFGYQARAVFKGVEVSLGTGVQQNTDDPFGDMRLFITPMITKQFWHNANWDMRVTAGCDVFMSGGKPNPEVGILFRYSR